MSDDKRARSGAVRNGKKKGETCGFFGEIAFTMFYMFQCEILTTTISLQVYSPRRSDVSSSHEEVFSPSVSFRFIFPSYHPSSPLSLSGKPSAFVLRRLLGGRIMAAETKS